MTRNCIPQKQRKETLNAPFPTPPPTFKPNTASLFSNLKNYTKMKKKEKKNHFIISFI
jgi:hypothetical protein